MRWEMFGMPEHKVLAGAFHKTGTVLMGEVFRIAAGNLGLKFLRQNFSIGRSEGDLESWDIAFVPGARFERLVGDHPWRGVVCIRDPRDVIISAAHYHCKASEAWLHRPMKRLGGKTYQETILGLPSDEERYLFEMENSAAEAIRGMLRLEHPPENITVTSMELLATDTGLEEFRRIFGFLGFAGEQMEGCLKAARNASLFDRIERLAERTKQRKGEEAARNFLVHRRSGGRPAQWRGAFTPRVLAAFVERFGDAPERLGYPPSVLAEPEPVVLLQIPGVAKRAAASVARGTRETANLPDENAEPSRVKDLRRA